MFLSRMEGNAGTGLQSSFGSSILRSVEFEEGQEPKAVMQAVLKACRKVEPDCEIEI